MSDRTAANSSPIQTKLSFGIVFGVLFAFWTAMAVCIGAIVIVAASDSDDGAGAAPAATVAPPTPTATPEARPPTVPLTAQPLDGEYDSGEPRQHLFFHIACVDGILAVITTDERVYAETTCPDEIQRVFVEPFLGDPVRIIIAEGRLDLATIYGERLQFPIGRVWIERP